MSKSNNKEPSSLIENGLASAFAGIISRIFTHPLDTAKARLQAVYTSSRSSSTKRHLQNPYKGPIDVLVQTAQTEGIIKGLYRGFGAVIVGGTPGTMAYLLSYEKAKDSLSEHVTNNEFVVHFSSGMIAETVACIIYVPVDVIKERMQVQRNLGSAASDGAMLYRNSMDALIQISKSEGLSGIYRGYAATLGSFGPFSALYFVFYERFKFWARQNQTGRTDDSLRSLENVELPFQWILFCSAGAGAIASWMTSPLDLAKLRLQVSRGRAAAGMDPNAISYTGVVDCLKHVYRDGGVKGLWRGAGARVLHFAPATTITMTSYETCRSFVANLWHEG